MDAPFFPYIRREINHGLRGGREKTHGSSPSTSGKTNEKPSEIQTRRRQCTIDLFLFDQLLSTLSWSVFHTWRLSLVPLGRAGTYKIHESVLVSHNNSWTGHTITRHATLPMCLIVIVGPVPELLLLMGHFPLTYLEGPFIHLSL